MRAPDRLGRHIRHAEDWLRWARRDHRRGNFRGVVLRLLLAEAEIRHAREAADRPDETPGLRRPAPARIRPLVAGTAGAALIVCALGVYAAIRPGGPLGSTGAAPVPAAVRAVPASGGPDVRTAPSDLVKFAPGVLRLAPGALERVGGAGGLSPAGGRTGDRRPPAATQGARPGQENLTFSSGAPAGVSEPDSPSGPLPTF